MPCNLANQELFRDLKEKPEQKENQQNKSLMEGKNSKSP